MHLIQQVSLGPLFGTIRAIAFIKVQRLLIHTETAPLNIMNV